MTINDLRKWEEIHKKGGGYRRFTCVICKKSFVKLIVDGHATPLCCSKRCYQVKKNRKKHLTSNNVRKRFKLKHLLLMYNFICYWCGTPVEINQEVPHPLAPTRDHYIPRSKGGPDAWNNLVLAHYSCNKQKGNKMPNNIPNLNSQS